MDKNTTNITHNSTTKMVQTKAKPSKKQNKHIKNSKKVVYRNSKQNKNFNRFIGQKGRIKQTQLAKCCADTPNSIQILCNCKKRNIKR